jgi:multiple sugar transport system ATP-binding protein
LGTLQVVTVQTKHGPVKARSPCSRRARIREQVGLRFAKERLVVFDAVSGRALNSRLFEQGEEATHV